MTPTKTKWKEDCLLKTEKERAASIWSSNCISLHALDQASHYDFFE